MKAKCKLFGHKWVTVLLGDNLLAKYCSRCDMGYKGISDYIDKNKPCVNTYNIKKYYKDDLKDCIY
jgi:hypothetical protein